MPSESPVACCRNQGWGKKPQLKLSLLLFGLQREKNLKAPGEVVSLNLYKGDKTPSPTEESRPPLDLKSHQDMAPRTGNVT